MWSNKPVLAKKKTEIKGLLFWSPFSHGTTLLVKLLLHLMIKLYHSFQNIKRIISILNVLCTSCTAGGWWLLIRWCSCKTTHATECLIHLQGKNTSQTQILHNQKYIRDLKQLQFERIIFITNLSSTSTAENQPVKIPPGPNKLKQSNNKENKIIKVLFHFLYFFFSLSTL